MIVGTLLQRLPTAVLVALVASAVEIGGGAWLGHSLTANHYRAQIATEAAARAKAVADAASAAQAETARRVQAQSEIAHDAQAAADAARADAARADAAAGALRLQLGAYVTARAGTRAADPAAAAPGQAAGDAARVLAELLGMADETAGRLAAAADSAHAAGTACERAYDALTQRGN